MSTLYPAIEKNIRDALSDKAAVKWVDDMRNEGRERVKAILAMDSGEIHSALEKYNAEIGKVRAVGGGWWILKFNTARLEELIDLAALTRNYKPDSPIHKIGEDGLARPGWPDWVWAPSPFEVSEMGSTLEET